MKIRAVRIYGKEGLRLEEFELPSIRDDGILVKIVSDSLYMTSYKAHKRVKKLWKPARLQATHL